MRDQSIKVPAKRGRPKGLKLSPETIEKIRAASIRRWNDPAYRAHHLPLLLAAASRGGQAFAALHKFRPRRGTPEFNQYEKVRSILGLAAAHSELGR